MNTDMFSRIKDFMENKARSCSMGLDLVEIAHTRQNCAGINEGKLVEVEYAPIENTETDT